MTTADEILAAELGFENVWFEVDLEDRVIRIPKGVTNLGVKSDEDVKHVRFKMPRVYHDSDLSTFKIGIDYTNAEGEPDRYEPTDIAIAGDLMTFTWVVGRHAAIYNGNVTFSLCCKKTDSAGNVIKELHTTDAVLPILKGTETCEFAIVEHTDLLEQWREQLFGTGESIITNINETAAEKEAELVSVAETQMTEIEAKTAASLETIPDDYTETYNNARQALRTRANAIVETAQGENVTITDASDDYLRGMRVFGKSTQVHTTGKNLLQHDDPPGTYIAQGITFTVRDDGSVVCHGTATNPATISFADYYLTNDIILSGCPAGGDVHKYRITADIYKDGTYVRSVFDLGSGVTITTDVADYIRTNVFVYPGITVSDLVVYPMIRLATVTDDTYEPYTGGMSSPSPEYPQRIESVENPTVTVISTNMFDTSAFVQNTANNGKPGVMTLLDNGITVNTTSYLENYSRYDFGFEKSTRYTIAYTTHWTEHSHDETQFTMSIYYDDGTQTAVKVAYSATDKMHILASVSGKNVIAFGIGHWMYSGVCEMRNIMLVKGAYDETSMPVYTPYDAQAITLNRTLSGFPVKSGGNYTDSDGQQWICDEVDFERGIYIQRIGRLTLTGDLAWGKYNWQTYNYGFSVGEILEQEGSRQPGICNQFAIVGAAGNGVDCVWVGVGNRTVYVITEEWYNLGTDAWKAHLNETPLEIAHVLATPVITELTESELYTFSQLHSNYPNTAVLNDSGAHMAVSYNADTKTYFTRSRASDEQVQAAVDAWLTAHYASAEEASF